MKTLIKVLLAGFLLLVVLIAVGGVVLFMNKDSFLKAAIERSGTETLGVETTVETVHLDARAASVDLAGLKVANPDGYPSSHFMSLPSAGVEIEIDSLGSDVIRVPVLTVGKIDAILDGTGGTPNYRVILDNVKKDEDDPAPPSDAEGPQFVIGSLVLEGAAVKVTGFPGMAQVTGDVTVDVPRVELQDVGSAEPMTAGEVISLVVKTVLATTIENGGGVLPEDLIGNLEARLASMTGLEDLGITAIGDVGVLKEQLRETADDAIEDVKNQAEEKVRGALDSLLGGGGNKDDSDDDEP